MDHSFRERVTMHLFPNLRDIGLHLEGRRTDHLRHFSKEGEAPTGPTASASPSFSLSTTDAVQQLLSLLEEATTYFFPSPSRTPTESVSSPPLLPRWGVHRSLLEQLFLHVYFFPGVVSRASRRRLQQQCTAQYRRSGVELQCLPSSLHIALQSCVTRMLQSSSYSMHLALEFLCRKGEEMLALECFMIWWYANPDQVPVELPWKDRFLPFAVCGPGREEEEEDADVHHPTARRHSQRDDRPEDGLTQFFKTSSPSPHPRHDSLGFLCPRAIFSSAYQEGLRRHLRDPAVVMAAKNTITSSLLLRVWEVAFSIYWRHHKEGSLSWGGEEEASWVPPSKGGRGDGPGERGREMVQLFLQEWILPLCTFPSPEPAEQERRRGRRPPSSSEEKIIWCGRAAPPSCAMEVDPFAHWVFIAACVGAASFLQAHSHTLHGWGGAEERGKRGGGVVSLASAPPVKGLLRQFLRGMSFLYPSWQASSIGGGPPTSVYAESHTRDKTHHEGGGHGKEEEEAETFRQAGGPPARAFHACLEDAFYGTLQPFLDGGAYHRIHPSSSARICEKWMATLWSDFPDVFVAESMLTTLWVLYMLEHIAASRSGGGSLPLSFFGQEHTMEVWQQQCGQDEQGGGGRGPSSFFSNAHQETIATLLGAQRRGKSRRQSFLLDAPLSSCSSFSAPNRQERGVSLDIPSNPHPHSFLPKGNRTVSTDRHASPPRRGERGATAELSSSLTFVPCTISALTMRYHASPPCGRSTLPRTHLIHEEKKEKKNENCTNLETREEAGVMRGGWWWKDGCTPVEVLTAARAAVSAVFLRFLWLTLSEARVVLLPGFAGQPSAYVLLRLLHLFCFLGDGRGGGGGGGETPSLEAAAAPPPPPPLPSSSSDALVECLTHEVAPLAHAGLRGYLRRLHVLYLSHSGRSGAVQLFSPPHRLLLHAFSSGRAWQITMTTLLWSGLPANASTRALIWHGKSLSPEEASALQDRGGRRGQAPFSSSSLWGGPFCSGRGSLAWEALGVCWQEWGVWEMLEGRLRSPQDTPTTIGPPPLPSRPAHHLPLLREVLTHLLLLATTIPDEAPELLSLSRLYDVAVSPRSSSSSLCLLPLFYWYEEESGGASPRGTLWKEEGEALEGRREDLLPIPAPPSPSPLPHAPPLVEEAEGEGTATGSHRASTAALPEHHPSWEEEEERERPSVFDGEVEAEEEDWVHFVEREQDEAAQMGAEMHAAPGEGGSGDRNPFSGGGFSLKEQGWWEGSGSSTSVAETNALQWASSDAALDPDGPMEAKEEEDRLALPTNPPPPHREREASESATVASSITVANAVSVISSPARHVFLSLLDVLGWWMGDRTSPLSSGGGGGGAAPDGVVQAEKAFPIASSAAAEDRAYHTLLHLWTSAVQRLHFSSSSSSSSQRTATAKKAKEDDKEEDPLVSTAIVSAVLQVILSTCPDAALLSVGVILLAGRQWKRRSASVRFSPIPTAAAVSHPLLSPPPPAVGVGVRSRALLPWYLECALCRLFYHMGITEKEVQERWWGTFRKKKTTTTWSERASPPVTGKPATPTTTTSGRRPPSRWIGNGVLCADPDGFWDATAVAELLDDLHAEELHVLAMLFTPLPSSPLPSSSASFSDEGNTGGGTGVEMEEDMERRNDTSDACAFVAWKEKVALASLSASDLLLLCASITLQSLYRRFLCDDCAPPLAAGHRVGEKPRPHHLPFYPEQFAPSLRYRRGGERHTKTRAAAPMHSSCASSRPHAGSSFSSPPVLFPSLQLYARHPSRLRQEIRPLNRYARFPVHSTCDHHHDLPSFFLPFTDETRDTQKENTTVGSTLSPPVSRRYSRHSSSFSSSTTCQTFRSLMSMRGVGARVLSTAHTVPNT